MKVNNIAMGAFRIFLEQDDFVGFVLNEINAPSMQAVPQNDVMQQQSKPWSAKKDDIIQMWKQFRPDTPIILQPISDYDLGGGTKRTFGEDGIRITGSWNFIAATLARLKELIYYENPQTKLRLVFRGVDKSRGRPDRQSFVFYLNLEKRATGKAGRPKIS